MENIKTISSYPKEGFTHGGVFHADDVFSTAFLEILQPEFHVTRGFNVPDTFDGIVYDIGGGKFDHHQEPRELREDGIPYAAFGKLWREYGYKYLSRFVADTDEWERYNEAAVNFDKDFIEGLDLSDNTGSDNLLASAISTFNPAWNNKESFDDAFTEAVAVAKIILQKEFARIMSELDANNLVFSAMKEQSNNAGLFVEDDMSRILVLDQFVPAMKHLIPSGFCFLITPSPRGGWNAQVVPKSVETRNAKVNFPRDWWGKSNDQELLKSGITFCHASGFLLAATTKEAAIAACKTAMMSERQ